MVVEWVGIDICDQTKSRQLFVLFLDATCSLLTARVRKHSGISHGDKLSKESLGVVLEQESSSPT